MTASPVIVGRSRERDRLCRVVDDLRGGRVAVAVVVGDAGIGKSTLLDQVVAHAVVSGVDVVVGRGEPLTADRPALALLDALDVHLEGGVDTALLQAPVSDPSTLLAQRLADQLDRRAAAGPVLVVLDDVQWLDRASLTLVQHLASRSSATPVGVVAAARPPTPGSALHLLLTGLGERVLTLGPLGADEIDELAAGRLGRAVGPRLRTALDSAGGNPMLVEAILDAAVGGGTVHVDADRVELTGNVGSATPGRAMADQLAVLEPEALGVVQAAAVAGRELRIDVLTRVLRRSPIDVVRHIGAAISGGVLVERDGEVAFRHDLYRDAALATLPEGARQALHVEVAAALAELGAPVLAIADHYARGAEPGDRVAARHLAAAAAEVVGAAPGVALRLCEVADTLAGPGETDLGVRATRLRALAGCGRIGEAERLADSVLHAEPDPALEAQVRRELALTAFIDGRPADASTQMRRVVDLARDDRELARAHAELAFASLLALDRDGARANADLAVRDGQLVGDVDAEVMGRAVLCWQDLWACDLDAADAGADALADVIEAAPPGPWHAVQPWLSVAGARLDVDRDADALEAAERGRHLSIDTGSTWATAVYDALVADVCFRSGRLDDAEHRARAAVDGTALVDGFGVEVWARSTLAHVALTRGGLDAALAELEAAEVALNDGRAQFGLDRLVLAQALAHELAADLQRAHGSYREGWELMQAIGIVHPLPSFAPGLVRTAVRLGVVDDLAAVTERVEAMAATTRVGSHRLLAAHARAWLSPRPDALDVLGELADAVAHPVLAHAAWRDLVELEERVGRADRSVAAARRAAELASGWRIDTPPVDAPRTRGARPRFGIDALTPAERRVADLVAEGLTNAQIAAELVVSRRTVDSHVLAAYRKLEVASRVALTRKMLEVAAP